MANRDETSQPKGNAPAWGDAELFPFAQRNQYAPHLLLAVIVAFFLAATVWAGFATSPEPDYV